MLPIIGHKINLRDLITCFVDIFIFNKKPLFKERLAALMNFRYVFLAGSGTVAFYVLLRALKAVSKRCDVIIPAYTASILPLVIKKAGLNPVFCDIEKGGFNIDLYSALDLVTDKTLCVLSVHMFGLPANGIKIFRQKLPKDVFLIEDCAQAMGTKVDGRLVGDFSDAAFTSFNRGKNLPLYGGGCIFFKSDELGNEVNKIISEYKYPGLLANAASFLKLVCLVLAFNRFFYGFLYRFIASSKEKVKDTLSDFKAIRGTAFQESLGVKLSGEFEVSCRKRAQNALGLLTGLKDCGDIVLPDIKPDEEPVLNRFPVIFTDLVKKRRVKDMLFEVGIETSEFYLKPLHHIFELGYRKEEFPNACYLAEHLLTLPVHPMVREEDLQKMINIIRDTDSRC